MNLGHRIADENSMSVINLVFHRIRYPLNIFIPIAILFLSFFNIWQFFGQKWEIGVFSTRFIPWFSEILGKLFNLEANIISSNIILTLVGFGPLAFYFFTYNITRRHYPALITSLITMLPLIWISSNFNPRVTLAIQESDGAHVAGLTLIIVAAYLYLRFIRNGKYTDLFFIGILFCLTGSISFFALYIFISFFLLISISEVLLGFGKVKLKRFLITGVLLFASIIFIYNFDLVSIMISEDGRTTLSVLTNLIPMSFFLVPIIGTFAFLIFDRRQGLQPLFLAIGIMIIFGLLHFVRVSIVDIPLLHQDRYSAEVSFAIGFFTSILLTYIFDLLRSGWLINRIPFLYSKRTLIAFMFAGLILLGLIGSLLFISRELSF